ncbi:metallophosphoesterase [Rhodobacteraceae bacterium NNCM2]|nr:metallophosphoesterase [Coraliihabitans acroporae]
MSDLNAIPGERSVLLPPVYDELRDLSDLPRECEVWPIGEDHSGGGTRDCVRKVIDSLEAAARHGQWQWPDQPVVFLSDPHADAEGFLRSLVAAGVIRRTGGEIEDFELTPFGSAARIVIGGDCLDKGPCNLDMLDALKALIDTSVELHLLAGNHDLRLMLAVRALSGPRSTLTDHLFVRMGRKIVPLLREVYDTYVVPDGLPEAIGGEAACRARIFPRADWPEKFPAAAAPFMTPATIRKEMTRLGEKQANFDAEVAKAGMTMQAVYAATLKCNELFLEESGPYGWFFASMDAISRIGSLLFVHAGLDDEMCALLAEGGPDLVNRRYRREARNEPFAFYSGSAANLVRTKYRKTDKHLTEAGVRTLHRLGIKMVVQGHVNNRAGQRILAKNGLLHLEGDVTLDRSSRSLEGLAGIGAGATLIFPSGDVVGISSDYPKAKHFNPERHRWETEGI